MSRLTFVLLLVIAALFTFIEGHGLIREGFLGTRLDWIPALLLYVAFRGSCAQALVLAACAGLFRDSLSANPLGVSLIAYALATLTAYRLRELLMRDLPLVQALVAGIAVGLFQVASILVLWIFGYAPLVGWETLAHLVVLFGCNAVMAPLFFVMFDWLESELTYKEQPYSELRPEVEIRRNTGH